MSINIFKGLDKKERRFDALSEKRRKAVLDADKLESLKDDQDDIGFGWKNRNRMTKKVR
jgi:hypothetical protein